ncbi:MAG: DUF1287 domain-containing protein [Phycisphaerae bacterium]|nr:DUF1287 domain-containing protein [Phycisphaerae bacterium]
MTNQPDRHPVSEVAAPASPCEAGRVLVRLCVAVLLGTGAAGCERETSRSSNPPATQPGGADSTAGDDSKVAGFGGRLSAAAVERTRHSVRYDSKYMKIPYPGGDVPAGTGVCTDVVIRSFRAVGIDLQKEVHEDMRGNFSRYPRIWGLKQPDTNIDHRRVPNLMTFFERRGVALPVTREKNDYLPGDVVAWKLGNGRTHIGLVVDRKTSAGRPMVVHNIGAGPKVQDCVFSWKIIGHYRYPHRSTS